MSKWVKVFFLVRSQAFDRRYAVLHETVVPRALVDYVMATGMAEACWPDGLVHTAATTTDADETDMSFFETHFKMRAAGLAAFVEGWTVDLTLDEMHRLAADTGLIGLDHPYTPERRKHKVARTTEEGGGRKPRGQALDTDTKRKVRK